MEIPATLLANFPELAQGGEYVKQPAVLYDTLEIPISKGFDPTGTYHPYSALRHWTFFEAGRGDGVAGPGVQRRKKGIFDTNLLESGRIPLNTVYKITEIGFRVCPITTGVPKQRLGPLYYWLQGVGNFKVEEQERFQFRLGDAAKAGNPGMRSWFMHDPDDSMLCDIACLESRVFSLSDLPADGYLLDAPIWLRPGIHFKIEVDWTEWQNWVEYNFKDGEAFDNADWPGARIEMMLYGVNWINANLL